MDNFVPSYTMGRRTTQTMLHITDRVSIEAGKRNRTMYVSDVLAEYEWLPQVGYWRWTVATVFGSYSDGKPASAHWKYGSSDVPFWVVALVHGHYPEFRKTR